MKVYIPYRINYKREFFTGYGKKEFRITLLSVLVSIGISLFIKYCLGYDFVSALTFILIPIFTIGLVIKDECNLCTLDYIGVLIRFSKSRKFYPYRGYKWSTYM